jgi:hypothetical protein
MASTFIFLFLITDLILAQPSTYYNALNPSASSFVTDLENRIRSPYTKISYDLFDETNIANFASFDNGNGTRSVFCVYSHYEYIYSGTFTWLPISREHTFCHSWQPTQPSESLPEYSDQHHLFPTHQNSANVVRSNHPLGNVVNVISTFLEGTYGRDINGNLVYEPRDEHKGDAARAILYMPIRYNGISGNDWTFNWLNNTRLPSLSEGPQDLVTLIQWHKQDPPDKWEVDRNNYIQSIQQNRNPFVDHPEYINYINFNNLSKLSPTYANEPENYVTNFTGSSLTSAISFSWTDALSGNQAPSDYLLIVYNRNNYFLPIDGETYNTDFDLSDGKAVINIPYAGVNNIELTGTSANTTYYGTIFSYNGSGALTNYKINDTFPTTLVLFNGALAIEPTNHVTNFASGTITTSSVQVTWTDALPGAQVPESYLLLANDTGIFTEPVDGSAYSDDTNLSDGTARVNILYSADNNYTFAGLTSSTRYYFKIYPYNGNTGQNNYKTNGLVPAINVQTSSSGGGNLTDLFISEYVEGTSNNKAIEIFNGTSSDIDLAANGYKLEFYFNGASTVGTTINLIGTVGAGNVFVLASSSASSTILNIANQTSSATFYNGNDAVVLKKGTAILDVIGQVGFNPGTEWGSGLISTADNTIRRIESTSQGDTNPNDVFDPSTEWIGYPTDTFDGLGIFNGGTTQTFALSNFISAGWNMVSTPGLHPTNQDVTTWWSGKDPSAGVFRFSGGYLPVTTTTPGQGYWMKHTGANTYNYSGIQIVAHDPIVAATGWNLIGGYELNVLTANITTSPAGLQTGSVFQYGSGYTVATSLVPGYGYWIKLTAPGSINIPTSLAKGLAKNEVNTSDWGKIIITDKSGKSYTLYTVKGEVNLNDFELPPAPPTGMFDVRFGSGRYAEELSAVNQSIELNSLEYPVTVRVENADIRLQDGTGNGLNERLKSGEQVIISNSAINKLVVSGDVIPTTYSLDQNYPNPFNPSTKIEFSLPEDVNNVTLTIYNALGQRVAELVNSKMESGKYSYVWNAGDVATGLYIYELRTDKFVSVKKMVVLK